MSCLVWNCRVLGNTCTVNELANMMRAKDPSVVFLAETWVDEARLKDVKRKIKFETCLFRQERLGEAG